MTTPFAIPCILFAGGKSSRMGTDKSLLPFGGYTSLAYYQYDRLSALFDRVYISSKDPSKFAFTTNIIPDPPMSEFAPTAGFVAAFDSLDTDRFFALSVDAPFIDTTIISTLIDADAPDLDAVIAKTPTGTHPLCGIYHRSLASRMNRMLHDADHRLGKLLAHSNTQFIEFFNEEPFANLNHPHDYEEALSRYNNKKKNKE